MLEFSFVSSKLLGLLGESLDKSSGKMEVLSVFPRSHGLGINVVATAAPSPFLKKSLRFIIKGLSA